LLQTLRQRLSDTQPKQYNHRIALHGLGGAGKTQLALEYAYRYQAEYKYVFWISATDQAQLLSSYGDIAKSTGCITTTVMSSIEVAKAVLEWVRTTEKWLVIIDNLDDITIINDLLPPTTAAGHTLITTRNRNSDRIPAEGLEVEMMDPDSCVQFLLDRIELPDSGNSHVRAEARKIVEELGFLPLAIEQAAAYIRKSQKLDEFLSTYQNHRRDLLSWQPVGNYPYKYTVGTTWRMSLQQLQSSCPSAIILILRLAFLNPDEVLLKFLKEGKGGLAREMQTIIDNAFLLTEALNALESFSLVRVFGGGEKVSIHRLVQTVIKDDINSELASRIISEGIQVGLYVFPSITDNSINELNVRRDYRSQVIACLKHEEYKATDLGWNELAGRVAGYLFEDGLYVDCHNWITKTYGCRKEVLGQEHPSTLWAMDLTARVLGSLGKYREAVEVFERAVEIHSRIFGADHAFTLHCLEGLGLSYINLGRPNEATALFEDAFDLSKPALGLEHPRTLSYMAPVAWGLVNNREFEKAVKLSRQLLEVNQRVLGPEHIRTLQGMEVLAASLDSIGRGKEAVQYHRAALEARKRLLGPEHPETLKQTGSTNCRRRNSQTRPNPSNP